MLNEWTNILMTMAASVERPEDRSDLFQKAKLMNEEALRIDERGLGTDHPAVGNRLFNLGMVHEELNSIEEAKAMFTRALAVFDRAGSVEGWRSPCASGPRTSGAAGLGSV